MRKRKAVSSPLVLPSILIVSVLLFVPVFFMSPSTSNAENITIEETPSPSNSAKMEPLPVNTEAETENQTTLDPSADIQHVLALNEVNRKQQSADTGELYPIAYEGQYFNSHAQTYDYYSRSFDPKTGTWLQQDQYRGVPIDPSSQHRYMFEGNNPVNGKDFYGFADCYGNIVPFTEKGYQDWYKENCTIESVLTDDHDAVISPSFGYVEGYSGIASVKTIPHDDLKSGDVLLYTANSSSDVSKVINIATGSLGYSHTSVYLESTNSGGVLQGKIYQYTFPGEQFSVEGYDVPYSSDETRIDVFRIQEGGFNQDQANKFFEYINQNENLYYSPTSALYSAKYFEMYSTLNFGVAPGIAINYLTPRRSCADFVNSAYKHVGVDISSLSQGFHVSPNDLFDEIKYDYVGSIEMK